MCGIAAIIQTNNQPVAAEEIKAMTDSIIHRGPDAEGFFYGENFALGSRRLAIIDKSETANQPLFYGPDLAIIYNGAIYNYVELRDELIQAGFAFKTASDTEVILAAYQHWGQACVQHFNGMWAFAIYDPTKKILFCSRDRFGIKPFYYTFFENGFYFGSEIKQFTAIKNWQAKANKNRLYEFLAWSWLDHTSETCFEGVHALRGGQNLVYHLDKHDFFIQTYYDVKKLSRQLPFSTAEEQTDTFRGLFEDALKLRLRADVPIGASLSGGIDSSTIACLLKSYETSAAYQFFSSCNEDPKYSEEVFIDEVLKATNKSAHKLFPTFENFVAELDHLVWHQDEPFWDISKYAGFKIFEAAKANGISVMQNGQGADEILAGYDKFYQPFFSELLKQANPRLLKELFYYLRRHNVSFVSVLQRAFQVKRKKQQTNLDWLNPHWDAAQIFKRSSEADLFDCSVNMLEEVGLQALLKFEDRNSMAASVEARIPFLDYRLVEFCLALPTQQKIKKGTRKFILREAFKDILPQAIYERYDKVGFLTPDELWLRENPEWAKAQLQSAVNLSAGLINEKILDYFKLFLENKFADYSLFWRAIFFGNWVKVFDVRF